MTPMNPKNHLLAKAVLVSALGPLPFGRLPSGCNVVAPPAQEDATRYFVLSDPAASARGRLSESTGTLHIGTQVGRSRGIP